MTRSWLALIVLCIAVAAVGTFVYLKPRQAPQEIYRLSDVKPADARRVRMSRRGGTVIELAREPAGWRLVAPFGTRADAFHVERILAILDAQANTRFPATDLGRFELEPPRAEVTIDGLDYAYGTVSAVTGELYVRRGEWVYPVPGRYIASLPPEATALVSRQLFGPAEIPVRFEFPRFSVNEEGGRWSVTPRPAELSQDDVNRWVDKWRQASALRAEPHRAPVPAKHATIELKDGRRVPLGIEQQESTLAFTRFDENVRYYIVPNVARLMLAPPQGAPLAKGDEPKSARSKE